MKYTVETKDRTQKWASERRFNIAELALNRTAQRRTALSGQCNMCKFRGHVRDGHQTPDMVSTALIWGVSGPGQKPVVFSPISHQSYLLSPFSVDSHYLLAPPRRNSILLILSSPYLFPLNLYLPLPFPRLMEQLRPDQRFLSDLDSGVDFRSSGLLPDNLNLSPHQPTFDSFDLRPSSPHFPATPSYSGSYHNSPYSAVSELDFDSKDDSLGLFDNDPLAIPPREDYDPSKYDGPSTGLLMFEHGFMSGVNNSNRVSVSVTPADDAHSPAYYDQGSPASSNGGGESGGENGRRSPASSVSSHPGMTASPHLDFNQLHVESPYHRSISIPSEGASPQLKAQSPPVLVIPEPGGYQQDQPVIHAPEGDGVQVGPHLHIMPTTPISGGGEAMQVGFRNTVSQGPCPWRLMCRCADTSSGLVSPLLSHPCLCDCDSRGALAGGRSLRPLVKICTG